MAEKVVTWCLDRTLLPTLQATDMVLARAQHENGSDASWQRRVRQALLPFRMNIFEINEEIISIMGTFCEQGIRQALITKRKEPIHSPGGEELSVPPVFNSYVDLVVAPPELPVSEVDDGPFHTAMLKLGAEPERYAVIGEHPVDTMVAKKMGAIAVGLDLHDSPSLRSGFQRAGADIIADRPGDIVRPLLTLLGIQ